METRIFRTQVRIIVFTLHNDDVMPLVHRNGCLHHYASESDRVAKNVYHLEKCGGCARSSGEAKPFTFVVSQLLA